MQQLVLTHLVAKPLLGVFTITTAIQHDDGGKLVELMWRFKRELLINAFGRYLSFALDNQEIGPSLGMIEDKINTLFFCRRCLGLSGISG